MTAPTLTGAEEAAWDLTDLYRGMDDPGLTADLDAADAEADALDATYRGRIAGLSAPEMAELLERYEALRERAGKAGSFASLNWTQNTEDPQRGALHAEGHRARLTPGPEAGVAGPGDRARGRRRLRRLVRSTRAGALPPLARGRAPVP